MVAPAQAFTGWVQPTAAGGGGGPWLDDGAGNIREVTLTNRVLIGTAAPLATENLRVLGTAVIDEAALKFVQIGTLDAFARRQIWHTETSSILRLGANTAEGDAFSADSEGIIVYHPTGDQLGRMKADRFALTRATDSTLNYFSVDETSLFYRANPPAGTIWFTISRATGAAVFGATLGVVGNAAFAADNTTAGRHGMAGSQVRRGTNVTVAMSPYTILDTDYLLRARPTVLSGVTLLLPKIGILAGQAPDGFEIEVGDFSGAALAGNVVTTAFAGDTVNGLAGYTIATNYGSVKMIADLSTLNWQIRYTKV